MTGASAPYPFLKGHGTENDFVLLPDHDGSVHGDLDPARVRALCDRRAGIGGDGVLRVIRSSAPGRTGLPSSAEWFMDYRNADGSPSEMCGNGIRVFVRHLVDEGLVDPGSPVAVGTRGGDKVVTIDGDVVTADLGPAEVLGQTWVAIGERRWTARHVSMGNPHAVALVDDLAHVGSLLEPPAHDPTEYPDGVNVELVERVAERHVVMRVHERGSGETRSCGTGAAAVAVACSLADGVEPGRTGEPATWTVDVPGGRLSLTWRVDGHVLLTGPAVVVASGTTTL